MNILLTTARMPFSVEAVRRFGERGHTVYTTDTFSGAPGHHSKYVEERFVTASPRFETRRFVAEVAEIVDTREIDLVVPMFEEAFYLTRHAQSIDAPIFTSGFEVLRDLHDKARFVDVAKAAGVKVAETIVARSQEELREAVSQFDRYFARPAYSRGGVDLLTNTGPLKGELAVEDCEPTEDNPWLVQTFLAGTDVCTFSVAHQGRVVAHSTYLHPRTIENAGGIVFESIEDARVLDAVQRVVATSGYTGQLGMDFMLTDEGELYAIEVNARATIGLALLDAASYADSILDPDLDRVIHAPADQRLQIDVALVRDMFTNWRDIPETLEELFSGAPDVYARKGDLMPALYALLSWTQVMKYRKAVPQGERSRSDLLEAQFHDIGWDGQPIEGPAPTEVPIHAA